MYIAFAEAEIADARKYATICFVPQDEPKKTKRQTGRRSGSQVDAQTFHHFDHHRK